MLQTAVGRGLVGGILGTAVMTAGENIEQTITGRADSYVPAQTLARTLGLRKPDAESLPRNWAMHWGTGAVLGVVRGILAQNGLRGLKGSTIHFGLRLATDQFLENRVNTSAPPPQWSRDELAVDLLHKGIYAYVTGGVVDALVARR